MKVKIKIGNSYGGGMEIKRKCCSCKKHKGTLGGKISGKKFTCADCLERI